MDCDSAAEKPIPCLLCQGEAMHLMHFAATTVAPFCSSGRIRYAACFIFRCEACGANCQVPDRPAGQFVDGHDRLEGMCRFLKIRGNDGG